MAPDNTFIFDFWRTFVEKYAFYFGCFIVFVILSQLFLDYNLWHQAKRKEIAAEQKNKTEPTPPDEPVKKEGKKTS
uniref:Uncharacterized protein n=1 Tax=Chromera velia CCMP2878 TaxID=1169474 RepID=A0A0G4F084_9ALVE|eukprot:Cvel_14407.t1-p1 / transcript=Cvel_14407.t1 / gene=Cvel_14407 / organism=Chromera_velia_CCMP2878 / gene_product=hypothetical protein / transcript_product=hypothetical protein / location=Cvel_scaffold1024:10213-10437(+) / protein_length=75 / sequence_SO=supercontig / SO=protein_coding / is_pseudo=false